MYFLHAMFNHLRSRRVSEPDMLYSGATLQSAITSFRVCTGMSREYLASRLFITHTQLVNLESRGKPLTMEVLIRFCVLCREYNLPTLEDFFQRQQDLRQHRRPMSKQTSGQ